MAQRSWWEWFSGLALVRFILLGFLMLLAYVGVQVLGQVAAKAAPADYRQGVALGVAFAGGLILLGLYRGLVRLFERRVAEEADFSLPHLILGCVLGSVLFCAVYAVYFELGDAVYGGYAGPANVIKYVAIGVISGIGEEIAFRGVIFRVTEEAAGTAVALLLSGAFFGLIHMGNPHATWVSSAAIAIEAGIMLGAAYALTRNLWLAIGLHAAWNFTEGGIFGAGLSGLKTEGLFNVPLHGPELITGGEFGPEASIVAVSVCSLLTLVLLYSIFRRGEWVPLHWSWR